MYSPFIGLPVGETTVIHRLPALAKVMVSCIVILTSILLPIGWGVAFVGIAALLSLVVFVSRTSLWFLFRNIVIVEPFVIMVGLSTLFQPDGGMRFASIALKSTLSLVTILLLSSTTPFEELLEVLRMTRIPAAMISIIALMFRYIFVFIGESGRMRTARQSRSFTQRTARSWVVLASVLGQLFLRSTERAERIYTAMCARGWRSQ